MIKGDFEIELLEGDYALWLAQLLINTGYSKGGVAEHIRKAARNLASSDREKQDARSLSDAAVRNWFSRQSLPAPNKPILAAALVNFVSESVAAAPVGNRTNLTFAQLVESLQNMHAANSRKGKASARTSEELYQGDALIHEICSSIEIDARDLLLGSWLYDGGLPPYCNREIDEEIVATFNREGNNFVVLAGPPKAGKTRTLLECVKNSTAKNREMYWISPNPGSVDAVLRAVEKRSSMNAIFVLDDLQRFRFEIESGLTNNKIEMLKRHGMVIATLHSQNLETWISNRSDHSDFERPGPGRLLLDNINKNKFFLNARLSDFELKTADRILAGTAADQVELTYLASWLASVDALVAKTKRLASGSAVEASLVKAMHDARVLYPTGTSLEILAKLATNHFKYESPNAIWSQLAWEKALEEVTAGVTTGSPHSILIRNLDDPDKHSILDSVWQSTSPTTWDISNLDFESFPATFVARMAFEENYYRATIEALERLGPLLEAQELDLLGLANQFSGNLDEAIKCYKLAFEAGSQESVPLLLEILITSGEFDAALDFINRNHISGKTDTNLYRGLIALQQNDKKKAPEYFGQVEGDFKGVALYNLGVLAEEAGRWEDAHGYFLESQLLGCEHSSGGLARYFYRLEDYETAAGYLKGLEHDPLALYLLGSIALVEQDEDRAASSLESSLSQHRWFEERGILSSLSRPMFDFAVAQLTRVYLKRGDFIKAVEIASDYLEAAEGHSFDCVLGQLQLKNQLLPQAEESLSRDLDCPLAQLNLGRLYISQSRFGDAKNCLELASASGDINSKSFLAEALFYLGDYRKAQSIAEDVAAAGVPNGRTVLGLIKMESGDISGAIAEFSHHPEEPINLNNLGSAYLRIGKQKKAIEFYKRASRLGVGLASYNLALLDFEAEHYVKAKAWFEIGAKQNHGDCYYFLSLFASDENDLDEAIRLLEIGSDLGSGASMTELGILLRDSKRDFQLARKFLERAIEQQLPLAMYELSKLHEMQKDSSLAIHWRKKALDSGFEPDAGHGS